MLTSFANGAIFGTRVGSGNPRILALHGWGGSSSQLLPALEGLDAISLDLPGFGASPAPDAVWGANDYAKALLPLLEEFVEPPVVLGYSFGGRIAVHLAVLVPDQIRALVLTGAPLLRRGSSEKVPLSFRLARWANKAGVLSNARMEQERQKRGSADYRNATGLMRDILVRAVNETYETELARITTPLELIWGSEDSAAPAWIVQEVKEIVPATTPVRITMVENADHFLPVHSPTPVREALLRTVS